MTKEYSCSHCGFQVQSDDEDEVVDMVQNHAEHQHDMSPPEHDIRGGMTDA